MGNITALPGATRSLGEPDAEIIQACEDALDAARSGRMRAVSITWVASDGFSHNWASAADFGMTLLGAMSRAVHTWSRKFD